MNYVGTLLASTNTADTSAEGEWILKIEKDSHGGKTTIRLIGHFQSEHIGELKKQLQNNGTPVCFGLEGSNGRGCGGSSFLGRV
jgi:hypothetical protein